MITLFFSLTFASCPPTGTKHEKIKPLTPVGSQEVERRAPALCARRRLPGPAACDWPERLVARKNVLTSPSNPGNGWSRAGPASPFDHLVKGERKRRSELGMEMQCKEVSGRNTDLPGAGTRPLVPSTLAQGIIKHSLCLAPQARATKRVQG